MGHNNRLAAGRFLSIQKGEVVKNETCTRKYIPFIRNLSTDSNHGLKEVRRSIKLYKLQEDYGEYSFHGQNLNSSDAWSIDNNGAYDALVNKKNSNTKEREFFRKMELSDLNVVCAQINPNSDEVLSKQLLELANKKVKLTKKQKEALAPKEASAFKRKFQPVVMFIQNSANYKDPDRVIYYGHRKYFDYFVTLLTRESLARYFDIFVSKTSNTCLLDIVVKNKYKIEESKKEVNSLISEILSTVMVEGRPLKQFNAQLLLPFSSEELKSYSPKKENRITSLDDSQKYYFSPHVINKIFDSNGSQDPLIQTISLNKTPPNKEGFKRIGSLGLKNESALNEPNIEVDVSNIELHWSKEFGTGILAISLLKKTYCKTLAQLLNSDKWWHYLLDEGYGMDKSKDLSLAEISTFLYYARIVYKSFENQEEELKISEIKLKFFSDESDEKEAALEPNLEPNGTESAIATPNETIKALLKDKFDLNEPFKQTIASDRMFVNVAYCLAGDSPSNIWAKENRENAFKVLLDIDRFIDKSNTTNTVYSPDFSSDNVHVYRRWEHIGSLYGYTDHSNIYFGDFPERIGDDVTQLYGKMLCLQLMYKQTLDDLVYKFSDISQLKETRDRMLSFTRRFWLNQVTEQQQGKDIYSLQGKAIGVQKSYEILDRELEQAYAADNQNKGEQYQNIGFLIALSSMLLTAEALRGVFINSFISPLITKSKPLLSKFFPTYSNTNIGVIELSISNQLFILIVGIFTLFVTGILQKRIEKLNNSKKYIWIPLCIFIMTSLVGIVLTFCWLKLAALIPITGFIIIIWSQLFSVPKWVKFLIKPIKLKGIFNVKSK